jgi:hypothetical protein
LADEKVSKEGVLLVSVGRTTGRKRPETYGGFHQGRTMTDGVRGAPERRYLYSSWRGAGREPVPAAVLAFISEKGGREITANPTTFSGDEREEKGAVHGNHRKEERGQESDERNEAIRT